MKVYLVTGNQEKIRTAKHGLSGFNIEAQPFTGDFSEIQAATSIEVARAVASEIARELQRPVIREDHSFCVPALNNFPGPFTRYIEKQLSCLQLLTLLENETDKSAYFELALAYADEMGNLIEKVTRVPVELAYNEEHKPHEWQTIMKMQGDDRFFPEYDYAERINAFSKNYVALAQMLCESGRVE